MTIQSSTFPKKEKQILKEIMANLKAGHAYGTDYPDMRYPYFRENLYIARGYIQWQHYGSSANRITLADLEWVITVIFGMLPSEFVNEFILDTDSKIVAC